MTEFSSPDSIPTVPPVPQQGLQPIIELIPGLVDEIDAREQANEALATAQEAVRVARKKHHELLEAGINGAKVNDEDLAATSLRLTQAQRWLRKFDPPSRPE